MLVDKDDGLEDVWTEFIRLGRRFGITAAELESLRRSGQSKRLHLVEKEASQQ